jgi:serine/threonine protein kinase
MPKIGDVALRFTLEEELGRSPTSVVFLGVDGETRWKAALKFFVIEPGSLPEDRALWVARIVREASAVAAFRHEHVVRVHEVGELASGPYLVRDFIEGRALAEYTTDTSRGSFERKVGWLRDLARTLADIHRAGLVHRDLKPSNVLVRRDGALRLLDFGVGRRSIDRASGVVMPTSERRPVRDADRGGERVRPRATPAYMAPERFGNQLATPLTDQFAWGVLAFELLTGRVPWCEGVSASPVKMIESILTQEPPSVRLSAPRLPAGLDAVLGRAMAKLPGARFPSMDDVLASFGEALR